MKNLSTFLGVITNGSKKQNQSNTNDDNSDYSYTNYAYQSYSEFSENDLDKESLKKTDDGENKSKKIINKLKNKISDFLIWIDK